MAHLLDDTPGIDDKCWGKIDGICRFCGGKWGISYIMLLHFVGNNWFTWLETKECPFSSELLWNLQQPIYLYTATVGMTTWSLIHLGIFRTFSDLGIFFWETFSVVATESSIVFMFCFSEYQVDDHLITRKAKRCNLDPIQSRWTWLHLVTTDMITHLSNHTYQLVKKHLWHLKVVLYMSCNTKKRRVGCIAT